MNTSNRIEIQHFSEVEKVYLAYKLGKPIPKNEKLFFSRNKNFITDTARRYSVVHYGPEAYHISYGDDIIWIKYNGSVWMIGIDILGSI